MLELVTSKPHWIITRNRLHLSGGVPEYVLGTMVDWCWNTWDKNSPKRTTFCEIGIHIFTNPKAGIFRSHSGFLIQSWSFWCKWLAKLNAGGHWIGRSTILTTSNHCFLEWPPVILCPAIFKLRFWEFSVWLIRYISIHFYSLVLRISLPWLQWLQLHTLDKISTISTISTVGDLPPINCQS